MQDCEHKEQRAAGLPANDEAQGGINGSAGRWRFIISTSMWMFGYCYVCM